MKTLVRVIAAPEVTVQASATGYGTVAPGRTWEAVAEVSGQIAWRSQALKDGNLVNVKLALILQILYCYRHKHFA